VDVLAITRGGTGSVFLFDSKSQADEHPLIQYGDVIVSSGEEVFNKMREAALAQLLTDHCLEDLGQDIKKHHDDIRGAGWIKRLEALVSKWSDPVWDALLSIASDPPGDSDEICAMIVADRVATKETDDMSTDKAPANKAEPKKPKTIKGHQMTEKITMGKDKDGNEYGPKNNPKRGASGARFAHYKNGITLEKVTSLPEGPTAADIAWDLDKDYIKVAA